MYAVHNEVPFRLKQIVPPGPTPDVHEYYKDAPIEPATYKDRCDDLVELTDKLFKENSELKHKCFKMALVLQRLIALRDARDNVAVYVANISTEDAPYFQKKANQSLDDYYINKKGIDWRKIYPVLGEETPGLYARLWEDLDQELSFPDFGPFT